MLITVLVIIIVNAACISAVYGEDGFATYEITVEYSISGDKSNSDTEGVFFLQAVDGAPMPGSELVESISIAPNRKKSFGRISYSAPGIYKYEVSCMKNDRTGYTQDLSAYEITIAVLGDGSVKAVFNKDGEGKVDSITYEDVYRASLPFPETGDDTELINAYLLVMSMALIALMISIRRRKC